MKQTIAAFVTMLILSPWGWTQAEPEVKDGKQTYTLTLRGSEAKKPASRYYLIPQYGEQRPGDQLSGFMKCFMEQQLFFNAENEKKRQDWLEMPLSELPKDMRELASIKRGMGYKEPFTYSSMLTTLDEAARFNRVEWNDYFNFRENGIYTLLPEVQKMRSLAAVLRLRLRGEVQNQEFDRAIITIRSMMGLAKMFETNPCLIGGLVGTSIQAVAFNGVEEMIQQPGCPSLYWSFIELPATPFNYTKAYEGERVFFTEKLNQMLFVDRTLNDEEIAYVIEYLSQIASVESNGKKSPAALKAQLTELLTTWAADPKRLMDARKRLTEDGKQSADRIKKWSALHVLLADDLLSYAVLADELMKHRNLPYPLAAKGISACEADLKAKKANLILAPAFLPSAWKIRDVEARMTQRVGFLVILEALRLHLAEHGQLPKALSELKAYVPLDPVTLKPYEYKLEEGKATLTGGKPGTSSQRVYELTAIK
ncbi:MAG: hypothetical protein ACRC8S_00935 [Fimbriiglobus sp.]